MKLNSLNLKLFSLSSLILSGLASSGLLVNDLAAKNTTKIPDIIKQPVITQDPDISDIILNQPLDQASDLGADLDLMVSELSKTSDIVTPLPENLEKPAGKRHGRYKSRVSPLKKHLFLTKSFDELDSSELSARSKEHVASGDFRAAALCIEREIALCKNHNQMCRLRLARADIWLAAGEVEKAASGYREFIAQYPSHSQTEYARYKLIKILFAAMPTCDRDQSGTSEALQIAKDFLANKTYIKYRDEVTKVSQRCYCQLFDSEVKKFEFYVNHRFFVAANKRFKYIEKNYPEFKVEIAELQKWLTAAETGKSYVLPENMRIKRAKKHYYGAKKRKYGAMF